MSTPVPTHLYSLVPYQSPRTRATQATGHAAIGVFAAVGAVAIPILLNFLSHPDYSRTGLTMLSTVVGSALLGLLLTFCVSYSHATGSDVSPTTYPSRPVYVPPGSPVPFVQPPRMPPIIDPALVTQLIESVLKKTLESPPPSATEPVSHA